MGGAWSNSPRKQETGSLCANNALRDSSRRAGKSGTLTCPDIQMAKSAMIHQAQFFDRMTIREPTGQFCSFIHAAMRLISTIASAHVQVCACPFLGCVRKGCDGRGSSEA